MKRSLMICGAMLALSLAATAAIAMPLDASHMLTAAVASASPTDLGAGVLMASAGLAVPMSEGTTMRAKLQVGFVQVHNNGPEGAKSLEVLNMHAVCASKYDETGLDEDNTFAKWSPGANLSINVANPALWDKFKPGDRFYVDFTPAV